MTTATLVASKELPMKKLVTSIISSLAILLVPAAAFAHVTVKPAQVAPAAFQTFTTGVPNEKEIPVTGLRLVIPDGLKHVSPNVKPGWQVNVTKTGTGEDAKVTEISWTGGTIPAGQRDDFLFSAQAPASDTTLVWKAYQTYQDGTVAAWDQKPGDSHSEGSTPYSETKVSEDKAATDAAPATNDENESRANVAVALSVVALVSALAIPTLKRKK